METIDLNANSWPTTRRAARGTATRGAGSRKSLTKGYGFMLVVPRTPCGRRIETLLMENQGVTSLKVSGTVFRFGTFLSIFPSVLFPMFMNYSG